MDTAAHLRKRTSAYCKARRRAPGQKHPAKAGAHPDPAPAGGRGNAPAWRQRGFALHGAGEVSRVRVHRAVLSDQPGTRLSAPFRVGLKPSASVTPGAMNLRLSCPLPPFMPVTLFGRVRHRLERSSGECPTDR